MRLFDRHGPLWLSAGLAVWLEGLLTVEWSYPYCLNQSDGPAYAAQGMPLPYWMWNGVISLEHEFLPHVYLLNIILLSILLFPIARWIIKSRYFSRPVWLRNLLGLAGGVLLLSHVALTVFLVSSGYYRSASSLGLAGFYSYSNFRPVRIGFTGPSATVCTPSRFWF